MTGNRYYIKAREAYPWDLEEFVENIEYAYSSNNECPFTCVLLGKYNWEQLKYMDDARWYFEKAMSMEPSNLYVLEEYIDFCINIEEYTVASRLIEFAMKQRGADRAVLYRNNAIILENQRSYKWSLVFYKAAKLEALNSEFIESVCEDIERVTKKKSQIRA